MCTLMGGSDQGISQGDTLVVNSDATKSLLVIAVSRNQSIVQFAKAAFPVTRGQRMTIRIVTGSVDNAQSPGEVIQTEDKDQGAVSIMDMPTLRRTEGRSTARSKISVDGRLIPGPVCITLVDAHSL